MADHSTLLTTEQFAALLARIDARINDIAMGLDPASATVTNPTVNAIRWNSANGYYEKWNGSTWARLQSAAAARLAMALNLVDNTSDADKPVSTAQATALGLKLNTSSFTAPAVLNYLLTVDGAGSGLDADKLDGYEASAFQLADADIAAIAALAGTSGVLRKTAANTWELDTTTIAAPAGSVIWHARTTAPVGYLKANGALVSRTTYSALFSAIGTTFGVGDGSTTFAIPDLRGEFVRGWDDGRGIDSGRAFGSAQTDDFKSHVHRVSPIYSGSGGTARIGFNGNNAQSGQSQDTLANGGDETRPRNIALLACIKY